MDVRVAEFRSTSSRLYWVTFHFSRVEMWIEVPTEAGEEVERDENGRRKVGNL